MKLSKLKVNPNNPQIFDDLSGLEDSLRTFPQMLKIREIVFDPDTMFVLGGNKRLICLKNLGYKEIPDEWTKSAAELTQDERQRFIIQDNIQVGDWDFERLVEWSRKDLKKWGLDIDENDENDIEIVSEFNDHVDFVIRCENLNQLSELQTKLGLTGKQMSLEQFNQKVKIL